MRTDGRTWRGRLVSNMHTCQKNVKSCFKNAWYVRSSQKHVNAKVHCWELKIKKKEIDFPSLAKCVWSLQSRKWTRHDSPSPFPNIRCTFSNQRRVLALTFWTRNYFLVLAHAVHKMRIIQEPNTIELWNKLHFEEEKTESIHHV